MDGMVDVTPSRPEHPDVERVRRIAWENALDWGWHEYAIDDPFKVERKIHGIMREILDAIGLPEDVRMWALPEPTPEV